MRIAPPNVVIVSTIAAVMVLAVGTAHADPPPVIPPAAAPPVEALPPTTPATSAMPPAPTLAPEPPAGAAPLTLEQPGQGAATAPAPARKPFYRKVWFWAAVGVAVATVTIVLIATANGGPDTPATDLGDHHAF